VWFTRILVNGCLDLRKRARGACAGRYPCHPRLTPRRPIRLQCNQARKIA
jgi:hypothetical protein